MKLIFRVAIYFSFVILITFLHFYKVIPSTTDLYLNIGSAIEPVKECFQGGCVKKVPEVGALKALSSYSGILILSKTWIKDSHPSVHKKCLCDSLFSR